MTIHYVLGIDSSPSMGSVTEVTRKGANEVIAALRNASREHKVRVSLTILTFDGSARILEDFDGVSIRKAKDLTSYKLGSGTAIYEGLGLALETVNERRKKNDLAVINLLTDGQNNTFGNFSVEKVKSLIQDAKETERYTFAIVAANQDARQLANTVGIPNAADYMSDHAGTRGAFFQLARAARRFVERASCGCFNKNNDDFFEPFDISRTLMKVNGLSMRVNLPESTHDDVDGLPPYAPAEVHVVDEYPQCPDSWMHGSAKSSSYFVGVRENTALWFDFNDNYQNTHDIAVVISVQGVNPLTGQKTGKLRLEKYDKNCPVHDCEFGQERFCDKCGFKWPAQNFISTTSCENNKFWLDGFRTPDGKVRQYVFTEETARGVANALIGEDKVYAVGVAFYKSKKTKPKYPYSFAYNGMPGDGTQDDYSRDLMKLASASPALYYSPAQHSNQSWGAGRGQSVGTLRGAGFIGGVTCSHNARHATKGVSLNASLKSMPDIPMAAPDSVDDAPPIGGSEVHAFNSSDSDSVDSVLLDTIAPKSFEVAAGETIKQEIGADPNAMDYWEDEPVGFMYLNYTDVETLKKIVAAGKRKEVASGFLSKVPVGNK